MQVAVKDVYLKRPTSLLSSKLEKFSSDRRAVIRCDHDCLNGLCLIMSPSVLLSFHRRLGKANMHKELFKTWVQTFYIIKIRFLKPQHERGEKSYRNHEPIFTAFQSEHFREFSACTCLIPDLRWAAGGHVHAPKAVL